MKKLLFIVLVLPTLCRAQNFEFAVNGGGNFHFLPINNIYTTQDKATFGYTAGFKADLILPAVSIGVEVDFTSLSQYNYLMPDYTTKVYDHIANPLITPFAFLNKRFLNTN